MSKQHVSTPHFHVFYFVFEPKKRANKVKRNDRIFLKYLFRRNCSNLLWITVAWHCTLSSWQKYIAKWRKTMNIDRNGKKKKNQRPPRRRRFMYLSFICSKNPSFFVRRFYFDEAIVDAALRACHLTFAQFNTNDKSVDIEIIEVVVAAHP